MKVRIEITHDAELPDDPQYLGNLQGERETIAKELIEVFGCVGVHGGTTNVAVYQLVDSKQPLGSGGPGEPYGT